MDEALPARAGSIAREGGPPFEGFFREHRDRLFTALWLVCRDRHEAEEVAQEAFVRVWERWDRVQGVDDPAGYLYRTGMNVLRNRGRRAALALRRRVHAAPPPDPVAAVDDRDALARALGRLTPRQRAALVLTDLLDMTSEEAARALGCGPPRCASSPAAPGPPSATRSETTMRDARDLLERAARSAPRAEFDLLDLQRRRDRGQALRRAGTAFLALALTAAIAGSAFVVLRSRPETTAGTSGSSGPAGETHPNGQTGATEPGALPQASVPALVAGPGEYYVQRIRFHAECEGSDERCGGGFSNVLAATFWWNPDDSGRIEVTEVEEYGITEGRFEAGRFPNNNGIDVSDFPTDPSELAGFLLDRSQPDGASPAPLVSPPPGGAPQDGRMWRAITDLLWDPHVTPAVRAALADVAAGLSGSRVELNVTDPAGRPAHVVEFGVEGGAYVQHLYIDPASHDLLALTSSWPEDERPFEVWLVESAGLARSVDEEPYVTSITDMGLPAATRSPLRPR